MEAREWRPESRMPRTRFLQAAAFGPRTCTRGRRRIGITSYTRRTAWETHRPDHLQITKTAARRGYRSSARRWLAPSRPHGHTGKLA